MHSFWGRLASLEIEGDDDHLGTSFVDRLGEDEFCFVGKVAAVLVDDVKESVAEFNFRDELEERQVEVATETHFQIAVKRLEQEVFLLLYGEVEHGVYTAH